MGKIRRLAALFREKDFVFGLAATFAAIIGVVSAILSITGTQFRIGIALLVIAVALAVTVLLHFRKLVAPQVAVWYWPAPQTLQAPQVMSLDPPQAAV